MITNNTFWAFFINLSKKYHSSFQIAVCIEFQKDCNLCILGFKKFHSMHSKFQKNCILYILSFKRIAIYAEANVKKKKTKNK